VQAPTHVQPIPVVQILDQCFLADHSILNETRLIGRIKLDGHQSIIVAGCSEIVLNAGYIVRTEIFKKRVVGLVETYIFCVKLHRVVYDKHKVDHILGQIVIVGLLEDARSVSEGELYVLVREPAQNGVEKGYIVHFCFVFFLFLD
jgi:hypothetical protein